MYATGAVSWLLIWATVWNCTTAQSAAGSNCDTPESYPGRCIDIRNCEALLHLLQGPRPLPNSAVDYLRQSQCGFEGRNPLVCCPLKPKPTTTTTTKAPPHRPSKPGQRPHRDSVVDVRSHPGLRLLPHYCGQITESKITGGNVTELFEFPWMALLGYIQAGSSEVQYRCGGSLISQKYVLTAAHCVAFLSNLDLVEVRLGEHNLETEEDCDSQLGCAPPVLNFAIERTIAHPQYVKDELRNDIALIRLMGTVRFSQAVRPICLPVGAEQRRNLDHDTVTVTGWGATEYGTASLVLLKVDLPMVATSRCAAIYNNTVPVTEKQLCAGGLAGRDSCGGDSGGPLQFVGQPLHGGLSYIQYGIVSFGPRQCGTAGRPGVYTRVGHYMDWLLNSLRS